MQKDKSTRDPESGEKRTSEDTDVLQINVPADAAKAEAEQAEAETADAESAKGESAKEESAKVEADPEALPVADTGITSLPEPEFADATEMSPPDESSEKPDTAAESETPAETRSKAAADRSSAAKSESSSVNVPPPPPPGPKWRFPWFGLFNFLLILGLAGGAYYYWQQQQQVALDYEETIRDLRGKIAAKPTNAQLIAEMEPIRRIVGRFTQQVEELETNQQNLEQASTKLYELYGRNKNEWQLAEVEYLMRVAQHKLILQDDFAGAAITLQAASDLLGETGDPGMLPVRVMISEEIADLRTRKRADLVGMTLTLAQLSREALVLQPGFAPRIDEAPEPAEEPDPAPASVQGNQTWVDQIGTYVDSLVEIRRESLPPTQIEASVVDVGQTLSDNLKLARWAVLERDVYHYELLLERSVKLFREYYDLDNAANADFLQQLTDLQKRVLKPEKPDITGSLREMLRILQQRDLDPAEEPAEASNG